MGLPQESRQCEGGGQRSSTSNYESPESVSYLATEENAGSPTSLPSPPPTHSEAARMQRSLAINIGTPETSGRDRSADLEPPLPDEAADHPTNQSPKHLPM